MRVQMAEQDHSRGREARPGVAVPVRHLVEHPARGRERFPGDGVHVLEADRDTAELGRVARREPLVGPRGRVECVLLVDPHPRVDRAWVAVVAVGAVSLADAGETGLDELARRQRSLSECRGRGLHAEVGRVGHGAIISRLRIDRLTDGDSERWDKPVDASESAAIDSAWWGRSPVGRIWLGSDPIGRSLCQATRPRAHGTDLPLRAN